MLLLQQEEISLLWYGLKKLDSMEKLKPDLITFTVGNEDDSNTHAFNVCAVIEFNNGSAYFSPPAGDAPACVTTSSIALDAELATQTIAFNLPVNVTEIIDISFTMEETS